MYSYQPLQLPRWIRGMRWFQVSMTMIILFLVIYSSCIGHNDVYNRLMYFITISTFITIVYTMAWPIQSPRFDVYSHLFHEVYSTIWWLVGLGVLIPDTKSLINNIQILWVFETGFEKINQVVFVLIRLLVLIECVTFLVTLSAFVIRLYHYRKMGLSMEADPELAGQKRTRSPYWQFRYQ